MQSSKFNRKSLQGWRKARLDAQESYMVSSNPKGSTVADFVGTVAELHTDSRDIEPWFKLCGRMNQK
jgi:hypothetical protein